MRPFLSAGLVVFYHSIHTYKAVMYMACRVVCFQASLRSQSCEALSLSMSLHIEYSKSRAARYFTDNQSESGGCNVHTTSEVGARALPVAATRATGVLK